jgi:hypothetical protein
MPFDMYSINTQEGEEGLLLDSVMKCLWVVQPTMSDEEPQAMIAHTDMMHQPDIPHNLSLGAMAKGL